MKSFVGSIPARRILAGCGSCRQNGDLPPVGRVSGHGGTAAGRDGGLQRRNWHATPVGPSPESVSSEFVGICAKVARILPQDFGHLR
jgi:hypothetical protein